MYTLKHIHTQYQNVHLSLALLNLTLIAADSDCLSPHTQYCNGGDLADYLQGKHHTNLSDTHTRTHRLFIKTKLLMPQGRTSHVTAAITSVGVGLCACDQIVHLLFMRDGWLVK